MTCRRRWLRVLSPRGTHDVADQRCGLRAQGEIGRHRSLALTVSANPRAYESLSGFLICVEGSQPHFYCERIPNCLIEIKFAVQYSSVFNLCDFGRCLMVDLLFLFLIDGSRRRGSIDLTCPDPPLYKHEAHICYYAFLFSLDAFLGSSPFCCSNYLLPWSINQFSKALDTPRKVTW